MKLLLDIFYTFFKIGLFTFGGGYAMIAQIKEIVVDKKHWITEDELLQVITIAESTPGPIAINMATYVGYKMFKIIGGIVGTIGVVLPSFIIIFIISMFLNQFMEIQIVQYAFIGINSAVAFLIIKTGITMLFKIEKKFLPILSFIIVFTLMILFEILSLKFSSIYFILIGGMIGILYYCISQNKKEDK